MPVSQSDSATAPVSGGFGRLARRITGWSANLLATALVLVAGLAVGRQVLIWWYDAPSRPLAVASDASQPPEVPDELRLWTTRGPVSILSVVGDRDQAVARMRAECQRLSAAAQDHLGPSIQREIGAFERRFLEKLAKLAPVEQTKELDLYVPESEVTMVVAVHRQEPRIAAWSFALESQPARWSYYTFCPAPLPSPRKVAP